MDAVTIRRAELKDADGIAHVRITGWRQSYRGIMPDALLDKLDVAADRLRVTAALSNPQSPTLRFVAERDGRIIGMGACGMARDTEEKTKGEVYAIYLLDEAKRQGTGRRFMREMARALQETGCMSLQVRVLKDNAPARRFYEGLGAAQVAEGLFNFEGLSLPDVIYEWADIRALAAGKP